MNIEDLERLSVEELEAIADASGAKAPADTRRRLKATIRKAAAGEGNPHPVRQIRWPLYAVAAAAACALVAVWVPSEPKDTFSSPELAYAELEKTFEAISSKVQEPVYSIIDRINE